MKKICSFCQKENSLMKCSVCLNSYYCSKECQIKHWKTHKVHCKKEKFFGKIPDGQSDLEERDKKTGFRLYPPFSFQEKRKFPTPFQKYGFGEKSFKTLKQIEKKISLLPKLMKIPFDVTLIEKNYEKCLEAFELSIDVIFSEPKELLVNYSKEIWNFIMTVASLYDIDDKTAPSEGIQEAYYETLHQSLETNEFLCDLIFEEIQKFKSLNEMPDGLLEMFQEVIPDFKLPTILEYFKKYLDDPKDVNPAIMANVVGLFCGNSSYKSNVRAAFEKNSVDIDSINFVHYLESIDEIVDEKDPLVNYLKKCSTFYCETRGLIYKFLMENNLFQ
jgi:hypothetical protein